MDTKTLKNDNGLMEETRRVCMSDCETMKISRDSVQF